MVNMAAALAAVTLGSAAMSCRGTADVKTVAPHHFFGPVLQNEVIAGRAEDENDREPVLLLVGERMLVEIDLESGTTARHELKVPPGVSCWGLARLRNGSIWTLKTRDVAAQVKMDGRIEREVPLGGTYFGMFGQGDRLLYQPADFVPPGQALFAGLPGSRMREPWSTIRTRPFHLARASVAALNLVSCGIGRGRERPCWFPDEAALALVDATGHTRRIELPGLEVVAPEVLLTSDNPARPIRDAYVDSAGTVWILSSGKPPSAGTDLPGAWLLARYGSTGEPLGMVTLTEPARLILRAGSRRAVLLTGSGMVAEVIP